MPGLMKIMFCSSSWHTSNLMTGNTNWQSRLERLTLMSVCTSHETGKIFNAFECYKFPKKCFLFKKFDSFHMEQFCIQAVLEAKHIERKIPNLYKITNTVNWEPSHIVHQKYHNQVANQLFNNWIWLLSFVLVVFKIV